MSQRLSIARTPSERAIGAGLGRQAADAGYAAIDALMALVILSTAVILSLQAMAGAKQAAALAWEVRRAKVLTIQLLETGPRRFEEATGSDREFDWRLVTQATGAERPIAICRRAVSLVSRARHKSYSTSTLVTCPPVEAA